MKNLIPTKYIPLLALGCGLLGTLLRVLLYAFGVDDRGLLTDGHFLHITCWVLTFAAAVLLGITVFRLDGSNHYSDNFSASLPGALGAFAAAAGILFAVVTDEPAYRDFLTTIWTVTGIGAGLCLIVTGLFRLRGKQPLFLFHALVCVFFALNLANHYRLWSGNPQTQDYLFELLACILLMLFAYYQAAFDAGLGQRRPQLFTGLMATILCCLSLIPGDTPLVYLGCGSWCLLNLCRIHPPRRRRRRAPEAAGEPAAESPAGEPDREVE